MIPFLGLINGRYISCLLDLGAIRKGVAILSQQIGRICKWHDLKLQDAKRSLMINITL